MQKRTHLSKSSVIVVGGSLGGTRALCRLLSPLPANFPLAVAVALHRHAEATETLLELVQMSTLLTVSEAVDKEPIVGGHVYLAPPDYHLMIEGNHCSLSLDDPILYARPSIDALFESAADALGPLVVGIILTGANHDGSHGAVKILERGGLIIIQDPASAESPQMPSYGLNATKTPHVYNIEGIVNFLTQAILCND